MKSVVLHNIETRAYNPQEVKQVLEVLHRENMCYDESTKAFQDIIKKYPPTRVNQSKRTATVQTRKYRGLMLMEVIIHRRTYEMLIDTGAQVTLLSKEILEEVGVRQEAIDMVPVGDSNDASYHLPVTCIDTLAFGPVQVEHLPVILMPGPLEFKKAGVTFFKVDAVLGWDVLRHLDFELDYKMEELRLVEAEEGEEGAPLLNIDFPSILIRDSKEHIRAWALDTGGKSSWINGRLISKLNLTVGKMKETETFGLHGGEKKTVEVIDHLDIQLYDKVIHYKNIKTGATGMLNHYEYDGVIGNNVLREACLRIINSKEICRLI